MKINKSAIVILASIATISTFNAQIKVFSGGSAIVGSTASPISGAKFQVTGASVFTTATGTVTPTSAALIQSVNGWSAAGSPDYTWSGDPNTGLFHPAADILGFTVGGLEKMRIASSGNLLLGGTTDVGDRFTITGSTNQMALSNYANHNTDWWYCQVNWVNRANTKAYSVISSATGSNVETFYVLGTGDVWGKSWTAWSDVNLKENITKVEGALDKVLQLKGVKYNFKTSVTGLTKNKTELGLLAQDVEKIVPEVVNTNDKGIKGIEYQSLVPLLIEAIKEQNIKINKLESELGQCCKKKTIANLSDDRKGTELLNPESINWLAQNKPNPFNKETIIEYNVVQEGKGSIMIFDMNGKLLRTIPVKIPGKGSIVINANDFIAGMYYYSLIINDIEVDTKKMILTEQ